MKTLWFENSIVILFREVHKTIIIVA